MTALLEHPTVKHFQEKQAERPVAPMQVDADWLRQLCLIAGADDVGFVELDRMALADQRVDILAAFPQAQTLISFVCRMNRDAIRTPARSVANLEFHITGDQVDETAHRIVAALAQAAGLAAIYHFTFTGAEEHQATVIIRDKKLQVQAGHQGAANLRLIADSQTWIRFLQKEQNLVWAILRRRIWIQGNPRLLLAFSKCFPT